MGAETQSLRVGIAGPGLKSTPKPRTDVASHLMTFVDDDNIQLIAQGLSEETVQVSSQTAGDVRDRMASDVASLRQALVVRLGEGSARSALLLAGALLNGPQQVALQTWERLHQVVTDPAKLDALVDALRSSSDTSRPSLANLRHRTVRDMAILVDPSHLGVAELTAGAVLAARQQQNTVLTAYAPNEPNPNKPALGGWAQLVQWSRNVGDTSSPVHKAASLGVGAASVALLVEAGLKVGSVAGGALGLGLLAAGYALGDLATGCGHWYLDNYSKSMTGLVFQRHHIRPNDVSKAQFSAAIYPFSRAALPVIAGLALLNPPVAVGCAAVGLAAAVVLTHANHKWSHMDNPPAVVKLAQKLGLAIGHDAHVQGHHVNPFDDNYCVMNGMWNGIMSRHHVWRKAEKIVYLATGREANCWEKPVVKELALQQTIPCERLLVGAVRGVAKGASLPGQGKNLLHRLSRFVS